MILMVLYSDRSERRLCEQLGYNVQLLFKRFLYMDMTELPFEPTSFSENRERLIAHDTSARLLRTVVERALQQELISDEHLSVDGRTPAVAYTPHPRSWESKKKRERSGHGVHYR